MVNLFEIYIWGETLRKCCLKSRNAILRRPRAWLQDIGAYSVICFIFLRCCNLLVVVFVFSFWYRALKLSRLNNSISSKRAWQQTILLQFLPIIVLVIFLMNYLFMYLLFLLFNSCKGHVDVYSFEWPKLHWYRRYPS